MFTVSWDSLDAYDGGPAVECEQVFETLGEAILAAEELDEDQWATGVILWDEDRGEAIPWPWG
jgi:hypothetical protein